MGLTSSDSSARCKDNCSNFIVVKGNIAEFKDADVLVNPIANAATKLILAGEVPKAFYKLGQDGLQEEYQRAGPPKRFGISVTVTGTSGSIHAKKIFHPAIGRYRDKESIKLLTRTIKICLTTAESLNMTSIAFPTVGCGNLRYSVEDVAKCFLEAAKETKLQIYIVAYTSELYETFSKAFPTNEELGKLETNTTANTRAHTLPTRSSISIDSPMKPIPPSHPPVIPIKKTPLSDPTALPTKPTTPSKPTVSPTNKTLTSNSTLTPTILTMLPNPNVPPTKPTVPAKPRVFTASTGSNKIDADGQMEMPIYHSAIADLTPEFMAKIQDLQSTAVQIHFDIDQSTVTLRGSRSALSEVKQRILNLLTVDEWVQKDLNYIKYTKGVQEYLLAFSQKNHIDFPGYWQNSTFPDLSKAESKHCPLVDGSPVFEAVAALVLLSWDCSLVGVGKDVRALTHWKLHIKNIWTIENPLLYTNYQFKRKALAVKAAHRPFSPVAGLLGEPEITTKEIAEADYLNNQLISEINEVYLFHGTNHVDEIVKNGIDCRFSGDGVLFGKGAYFAESSTKSDQYADSNSCGRSGSEPLYMFVARVLLGEPFLAQEARPDLKKAPCSTMGCKKDNCSKTHPMCDSVVGTHRNVDTPLLFREFIVYHPEQCYPEFLVEYVRVF